MGKLQKFNEFWKPKPIFGNIKEIEDIGVRPTITIGEDGEPVSSDPNKPHFVKNMEGKYFSGYVGTPEPLFVDAERATALSYKEANNLKIKLKGQNVTII